MLLQELVLQAPAKFFKATAQVVFTQYAQQLDTIKSFITAIMQRYFSEASNILQRVLFQAKHAFKALLAMVGLEHMSESILDAMQSVPGLAAKKMDEATAEYNITLGKVVDGTREKLPSNALSNDQLKAVAKEAISKKTRTKVQQMFGVTSGQLVAIILVSALVLLGIFAFLFVGITVFRGSGNFMGVINGMLVAFSGAAVNQKGKGQAAPQSNEVLRLLPKAVKQFTARALKVANGPEFVQSLVESCLGTIRRDKELSSQVKMAQQGLSA